MKNDTPIEARALMTTGELLKYMRISRTTLWRWQNRSKRPFPKPILLGGRPRFLVDEINRFIAQQWTAT